jgi:hypothetical protein
MYDVSFRCTYNLMEEEFTDDLYRSQLLQAFSIQNYDEKKISEVLEYVFKLLSENEDGIKIIELAEHKYNEKGDNVVPYLFCYDNFYLFHECLIDIIGKNKISPMKLDIILDKLSA